MKCKSAGFGLIDLLISMALILTAAGGLISVQRYAGQVTINNQQENDVIHLQDEIYTFLNDPSSCTSSFLNLDVDDLGSGNYSHPNTILKSDQVSIAYQTNGTDQSGRLQIQSMDLGDFDVDNAATPGAGKAILKILVDKNGTPLGQKSIRREIKLQVDRNPATKKLEKCVAIGGKGGNQLWSLNPDGSIYYSGGSLGYIGIGTNRPTEPIDVVSEGPGDQGILLDVYNNGGFLNGNFEGRKSRGTSLAPLPLLNNDDIASLEANPYDGASFRTSSYIHTKADANWAPGSAPTKFEFLTAPPFFASPQVRMVIKSTGRVGIGTTAPTETLDVVGNIQASGCVKSSAGVASGVCVSDERLKENIRSFDLGLKALLGFTPKTFRFNGLGDQAQSDRREIGLIAQDVERTAPELIVDATVKLNPNDKSLTKIKQVNYTSLIYIVVNSIKEFYQEFLFDYQTKLEKIRSLKSKISELEAQNDKLRSNLCKKDPNRKYCTSKMP